MVLRRTRHTIILKIGNDVHHVQQKTVPEHDLLPAVTRQRRNAIQQGNQVRARPIHRCRRGRKGRPRAPSHVRTIDLVDDHIAMPLAVVKTKEEMGKK